jgi:hypothetical protein
VALAFALISEWINIKEQKVKRQRSFLMDDEKNNLSKNSE